MEAPDLERGGVQPYPSVSQHAPHKVDARQMWRRCVDRHRYLHRR